VTPFGSGAPLIIDTSAWARQREPQVAGRWAASVEAGLFASCPVAALEILASARDEAEFDVLNRSLAALPQAPVTETACRAAVTASARLQARRRLPAAEYLIAAAAAERGFAVLHEDRHFDLLATVLSFESVRLSTTS
jgi:predicted nucleic acid-binding protein